MRKNRLLTSVLRLLLQALSLALQILFIVETVNLHVRGYVTYQGEAMNYWFSMLSTLVIVVMCEVVSFIEAALFAFTQKSKYSWIYAGLVILNAVLFCNLAYYTVPGTVVCLAFYGILFVIRIFNFVQNGICVFRKKSIIVEKDTVNSN